MAFIDSVHSVHSVMCYEHALTLVSQRIISGFKRCPLAAVPVQLPVQALCKKGVFVSPDTVTCDPLAPVSASAPNRIIGKRDPEGLDL